MNINTVKSVLNRINSKGASLIRKDTGLDISKAIKEGVYVPEGAKSFDAVRVGKNFNPKECYTDVFTFRDENGKIASRFIKNVDGKNVTETQKWYENLYPWEKDLDEFGNEVMEISARKVRSFTRDNGKIAKINEEVFAVTDEANPYLTHFKKEITPDAKPHFPRANKEKILLEERRNGTSPKIIENEYSVDMYNTGHFYLESSKASSPELRAIAQNSYFLPFVSPNTKFAYRMADACVQDAKFMSDPDISLYKRASNLNGYFSGDGIVSINLKSSKDLARTRESLTETIGHEVGHAKWDEKCMFYDFYKAGVDQGDFLRNYSKKEIPNIERYKYSIEHYITPGADKKGYYNQFCEKVAREEGTKAVKKYVDLENQIKEQFPNQHGFQFFKPNTMEDDLQGLFSLFRAWS